MLIAHLSDAHIGPLPRPSFRELASKRLTGYANWRRGRHATHDMAVLDAIIADIAAQAPGHIAFTGDVANIGLAAEFPAAKRLLERLGPPDKVSFVPGNHDVYVSGSSVPLYQALGPWMASDGAKAATSEKSFPYVRKRDGIALIGLCSGLPTLPLLASGKLGKRQMAALAAQLETLGKEGFCRVVMIHHPPHRGGTTLARGLTDAAAFERVIAQAGAELILHGHNHRISLTRLPGPNGAVPVLGAPSASAHAGSRHHKAGYHLVSIKADGAASEIGVRSRGLRDDGSFGELRGIGANLDLLRSEA